MQIFACIDRLFDTMNSRNPHAKGFKAPLGALNWADSGVLVEGQAIFDQLI